MAQFFNRERAAQVIASAAVARVDDVCEQYKISRMTLCRYHKRLDTDPELCKRVSEKMELAERDWAEELPGAIREAISFLKRASEASDHTNPQVIYSIAGALKILTDVTMSRRILDERLARAALNAGTAGPSGQAGEADRPIASEATADGLGLQ